MKILVFLILLINVNPVMAATQLNLADSLNRVIVLETTPCYGTCPVQKLEIFADGQAHYQGIANTERQGEYRLKLRPSALKALQKCFRDARFFEFKDSYQQKVSDLPSTYLTFSEEGRTKTILDYYGTPEAIKQLENEVLALLKRKGWRKVEKS